ncbi:hypothetical protein F5Y19DRAFT_464219 [Xylariaceae sp. FL1651]|nr:hypothetical protein F5Y19DRAFT_464219 [Xylariaceae sp. FL1651]
MAYSTATLQPDPLLPLKESLGYRGLLGVFGGTFWILGIVAFLVFLWFGYGASPEAANATGLWRFIAMHNYFPQTITLCSLALRIAVSFQAAVCTSMLAAIVLEKHGVKRRQVAWLSVMRSVNDGPRKLGELILTSKTLEVFYHFETWLTFFIIMVSLALQFSSTLLLSDINDFVIIGDVNQTQFPDLVLYKKDDFHIELTGLQFIAQPPVYAVLGETQAGFNATPDEHGLSDTGVIQRALVPLPEADARTSVRKLEGTSIVMSSQSACIRPQISAVYDVDSYSISEADTFGHLAGTIDYKSSFKTAGVASNSLCSDDECENVAFECPISSSTAGWQTINCLFDGAVGDGGPANFDPVWDPSGGPWSRNSSISLVITTDMTSEDWGGITNASFLPAGEPYQEWMSYKIGPSRLVNISLCSSAFSLGRFHTAMTAPGSLHEPRTELSLTSKTYSTKDVQNFMGVTEPQHNHTDRHILDLAILGPPKDGPPSSAAFQTAYVAAAGGNLTIGRLTTALLEMVMYYQLMPAFQANVSLSLCFFCTTNGYSVNPEISLLFNDVVTQTGRASSALSALATTVYAAVYYTYLSSLQVPQTAQIVTTTIVRTPGPCSTNGCPGFISVTALILAHLLCVATVTVLYVQQVRYSRHGSIWHTISQLVANDLTDVLEEANHASDRYVEHAMAEGSKDGLVKVRRRGAHGRVEFARS